MGGRCGIKPLKMGIPKALIDIYKEAIPSSFRLLIMPKAIISTL